ncbi:chitinase [Streptomyces tubbatahanensis]|uniref:Chitinase n=1 Tax=Streptomyces tubbatahanensis TaxID=2923272 RepID=A0ABY3XR26_9ACTN|nr:chitinase [Streptomyces tubbatahanensis]UNS96850.1 chitinase [Streptomyces tubbatahanensis]
MTVPLLGLAALGLNLPGGATAPVPRPAAPGPEVAPYLSLGWGDPPAPGRLLRSTGVDGFTFAFVLSASGCAPRWDGVRPLTGGADERAVRAVRAAGGEPIVSFGGGAGRTLEQDCPDAAALAGAYRKVIRAYGLRTIDVDIETRAYASAAARRKTVEALKQVKAAVPGLSLYVTLPSARTGPDARLIDAAARAGLEPDAWTIMPFAFGKPPRDEAAAQQARRVDMARATVSATEGLVARLRSAYGYDRADAYAHSGISTMNGITGHQEVVSVEDFRTIARYARGHGLARLAFWSVNRDRPCGKLPYPAEDRCSGVPQRPWEFTRALTSPERRS